jgi:hypothetical protein
MIEGHRHDQYSQTDHGHSSLASTALTGTPTAPTAAQNTNTTQIATTAFVLGQGNSTAATIAMNGTQAAGASNLYARADHVHPSDTSRAPLASPSLTGVPLSTTAAVDTATTQIATTAFVVGQAAGTAPLINGAVATIGTSLRYARQDHVHPNPGAWTAYTPTLGGFTPGNGTATGRYLQIGKLVIFVAKFTFGSTSAAAAAVPTLTLPVTAVGTDLAFNLAGWFEDTGVQKYRASVYLTTTGAAGAVIIGASGAATTPSTTTPFTWGNTDVLHIGGTYEAA